ncbi:MAG: AraC family transcriptional regulator [Oscillospiraceae bacterium]
MRFIRIKYRHLRRWKFELCSDILKTLNTFAFEYSKRMMNAAVTLDAQATVITHWMIRSILGETLDLRAVSSDYSIARAQHYIEQHYGDKITASMLSALGFMSVSSLNRRFRSEVGATPMVYLTKLRIEKAKTLLRRKDSTISEIALHCGFSSSAHFASCFIKHTGMTPREYQSKYID